MRYNMRYIRSVALLVLSTVLFTGCYHASITTGKQPSAKKIRKPFASSWIYGLVPPSTVEAAEECPNGVARVETQLSFVNQLVSFLTSGIYTPMSITVTCAAGASAHNAQTPVLDVPLGTKTRAALATAAKRSAQAQQPVLLNLHR